MQDSVFVMLNEIGFILLGLSGSKHFISQTKTSSENVTLFVCVFHENVHGYSKKYNNTTFHEIHLCASVV